jgi:hypothetical protein
VRPTLLALVLLALAGCGGSGEEAEPETAAAAAAEVEHVHGLGVDPGDGALLVATHRGLFRSAGGTETLVRVGEREPDVMGFTVVGAGRYLASGHPDPRDDLPSHLGLMETRDGGRTWEPVSLQGEADFHLLEARGELVLGGDAAAGRFLRSEDAGRTWEPARLPAPAFDVALDPAGGRRIVASTEQGLHASDDGARSWRRLGPGSGLLAWPEPDLLLVVGLDGTVSRSADGGRTLEEVGSAGGRPEAIAASAGAVYAALAEGRVVESGDGGETWSDRLHLRHGG